MCRDGLGGLVLATRRLPPLALAPFALRISTESARSSGAHSVRALQLKVPTGLTNATKIAFAAMTNINQFTSCRIRSPSPRHRAMVLVPKFHQIARRRKAQVLGSAEGVKSVWNCSPQASKICTCPKFWGLSRNHRVSAPAPMCTCTPSGIRYLPDRSEARAAGAVNGDHMQQCAPQAPKFVLDRGLLQSKCDRVVHRGAPHGACAAQIVSSEA